jgi:hypothetical protein
MLSQRRINHENSRESTKNYLSVPRVLRWFHFCDNGAIAHLISMYGCGHCIELDRYDERARSPFPDWITLLPVGAFFLLSSNLLQDTLNLQGVAQLVTASNDQPFGGGESAKEWMRESVSAEIEALHVGLHSLDG